MKRIFERGSFKGYSITTSQLNETLTATRRFSEGGLISRNTTVFLSHKHSDLEDLKGIIGFLHSFGVDVYIDSMDKNMPEETNKDTAARIKQIIRKCDRFILLATDAAVESKWCNWELGFGDANKFKDRIALFPLKDRGTFDRDYKGNEYMQLYPYIAKYDGTEHYTNGVPVDAGYYVCYCNDNGSLIITPLGEWLRQ